MRKSLWIPLVLGIIIVVGALAWVNRASMAAQLMHRRLGVPVSLKSLELTKESATLSDLVIGSPPHYRSRTALTVETIEIYSTLPEIRGNPLTIDEIDMTNLLLTLEHAKKGNTTNWSEITAPKKVSSSSRHYLIKALVFRNLTVQVITPDGKVKRYPTIDRLEIDNITDETGFPVSEIEKAIFNKMMQDLFKRFDFQKIFEPFFPSSGIPLLPF